MTDAFDVLAEDHQEVKQMLAELAQGPTAADGASEDQLQLRKNMTQQLIIEESRHEAAEEMYFWPAVREHLPDGDAVALEATGQEQEAKEILARLDKLDATDPEFEQLLGSFTAAALEHIAFEETRAWPGLRAALTAEEASELGDALTKAKSSGPTRPHPNTPASPGALRTAGPAVGLADKARDKITGRGD